jgi:hypothetical protein
VIAVPTNSSKPTTSDNTDRDPETTINVCLHRDTHTRLTAYKNDNPLIEKSYDEAINEILEKIDFPQAEMIENKYLRRTTHLQHVLFHAGFLSPLT